MSTRNMHPLTSVTQLAKLLYISTIVLACTLGTWGAIGSGQGCRAEEPFHPLATVQSQNIPCAGTYAKHLQGIAVNQQAIYWSFTTELVKTDLNGQLQQKVPVADHHGDLCLHEDKLYVAVNLGKFNDPLGNADNYIFVYDAESLKELQRYRVSEVFHGAGGIGVHDGRFYVVGGLAPGIEVNYVYEYDQQFQFVKRHQLASGYTKMGIQTATFADGRWWFGCYGDPAILLVTSADFREIKQYRFNCSLGIAAMNDQLLCASGQCSSEGCRGSAQWLTPTAIQSSPRR